ncbi:MAG: hypothetical protein HQ511_10615 [Rhodospirillales bacterium]|nr:hypothetical protein [Rhodospirillales bacterium]
MNHLFNSDVDGSLYDTRVSGWSALPPLRENYCWTHGDIKTTSDLKATLRAGAWAWPGGYPLYFITNDGGALSFKTVREELPLILSAIQDNDSGGWRVVACAVNWEDSDLLDDHTGEPIQSAYGH